MQIYAYASGELVRINKTDKEVVAYGPPAVYAELLEIDPDTNQHIVNYIDTAWNVTQLIGGMLYYNGNPVTVNPPSEYYQDHEYLHTWWQQLNTALDNTDAALLQTEQAEILWPTLTAKQKQDWLVAHFDEVLGGLALVLRVLHGILRFIRWLIKREDIV